MDIEGYECRAIMGSQEMFSDSRFDITTIVIEWRYEEGKISDEGEDSNELCPQPKHFVKFLVQNSYIPFLVQYPYIGNIPTKYKLGEKLDPDESHSWPWNSHILWEKTIK